MTPTLINVGSMEFVEFLARLKPEARVRFQDFLMSHDLDEAQSGGYIADASRRTHCLVFFRQLQLVCLVPVDRVADFDSQLHISLYRDGDLGQAGEKFPHYHLLDIDTEDESAVDELPALPVDELLSSEEIADVLKRLTSGEGFSQETIDVALPLAQNLASMTRTLQNIAAVAELKEDALTHAEAALKALRKEDQPHILLEVALLKISEANEHNAGRDLLDYLAAVQNEFAAVLAQAHGVQNLLGDWQRGNEAKMIAKSYALLSQVLLPYSHLYQRGQDAAE